MKRLLIQLSDEEYNLLVKSKGDRSWKDLLFLAIQLDKEKLAELEKEKRKQKANEYLNEAFNILRELSPENSEVLELIKVILLKIVNNDKSNLKMLVNLLSEKL